MTWFSIRAHDVWLFRDGKPFTAGEDNSARSIFPPTPLTVQGALRQKISEANGLSFRDYRDSGSQAVNEMIGSYQAQKSGLDTGAFTMQGPFVGVQAGGKTQPMFPSPADLLLHKPDDKTQPRQGFWISSPNDVVANDLTHNAEKESGIENLQLLQVREDYENLPDCWMTADGFSRYLEGKAPDAIELPSPPKDSEKRKYIPTSWYLEQGHEVLPQKLLHRTENRFGVSTDSATSFREEGMLYQAQFVRPDGDVMLLADVSGTHADDHVKGQMTLGGEQRLAFAEQVTVDDFPTPPQAVGGQFKIIFLTPAYFKKGWLPEKAWSALIGGDVTLVGAALYRPLKIGGWNSARGQARTMYHYVAPGSVYYFEVNGTITDLPPAITETPERVKDAAQIGFGQVAYGTW